MGVYFIKTSVPDMSSDLVSQYNSNKFTCNQLLIKFFEKKKILVIVLFYFSFLSVY